MHKKKIAFFFLKIEDRIMLCIKEKKKAPVVCTFHSGSGVRSDDFPIKLKKETLSDIELLKILHLFITCLRYSRHMAASTLLSYF